MNEPSGNTEQQQSQANSSEKCTPGTNADKSEEEKEIPTESNSSGDQEASTPEEPWFKRMTGPDWVTAIATVMIFIATAVYACVAVKQWNAMSESNAINREALESVQRAFLTCGTIVQRRTIYQEESGLHSVWDFTMPCRNIGPTAANSIAQAFFSEELEKEPSEDQFTMPPLIQNVIVGPASDRNVGFKRVKEVDLLGRELPPLKRPTFSRCP